MTILQRREYILEVQSLDNSIPSCSQYQCGEAGYFLYSNKTKWVLPFKKNRISLNVAYFTLPNNTIGIVSNKFTNSFLYDVCPSIIMYGGECTEINVRSKSLLPFRIKKGEPVATLHIIPALECHVLIS